MKKVLISLALSLFSIAGQAENHSMGIGAANLDADPVSITGLQLNYSAMWDNGLGLGLDFMPSASDDENGVDIEVSSAFALKARYGIQPTESTYVYLTAGWAGATAKASFGGESVSETAQDFVYGVGAELFTSGNVGFGVEYTLGNGDLEDFDVFQAVLKYRFAPE